MPLTENVLFWNDVTLWFAAMCILSIGYVRNIKNLGANPNVRKNYNWFFNYIP